MFKSTFNALINENYSISVDTNRHKSILEYALAKVGFSIGAGTYMFPRILNLKE